MKALTKGRVKKVLLVATGVMVGAVNGLMGGGGGMLTVPALHYLGGLETKKAHATAIAVMLPLSIVSAVVYTIGGIYQLRLSVIVSASVTAGGILGAMLLARLKNDVVALSFYLMMTAAGIGGIVKWVG